MGRALRTDVADYIYHVLNRANARAGLFAKKQDYQLFESILEDAVDRADMRLLAYTVMPNHWHLIVQPRKDGDLQKFMNWLTLTHTQRWHAQHGTTGYGHVYQGRYKSFLCEEDDHFLQLVRYVERNPLRANLVGKADAWQWGSAYRRERGVPEQKRILSEWPVSAPRDYVLFLNEPQTLAELESIRVAMRRGNPFGSETWTNNAIKKFNLETTTKPRGRPRKGS